MKRLWYKETREDTLKFIQNTVEDTIKYISSSVEIANAVNTTPDSISSQLNKKNINNLKKYLEDSTIGIENLCITYEDDKSIKSSLRICIDKIKNFGSKFSSMVTRQAAPTINKLTTQGLFLFLFFDF